MNGLKSDVEAIFLYGLSIVNEVVLLSCFVGVGLMEGYLRQLNCWVKKLASSSKLQTRCSRKEISDGKDEQVGEKETAKQGEDIMVISSADEWGESVLAKHNRIDYRIMSVPRLNFPVHAKRTM